MRLLVSERYSSLFFFFNDTATTEIYTLSLHDALPIHPFQSIGRYLVERGEIQLAEASMPAIKAWAAANPKRLEELLNQNPSFVFFRELPLADPASGPVGALGVPLAPGRSIAVDPRYVPLGAPVFLTTTYPASATPLTRLVLAQDTGGAIRNPVRADFFWGFGPEAGAPAGRMRQQGRMWGPLPQDPKPPSNRPLTPLNAGRP